MNPPLFTLPSASFATKYLPMPAMATLHTYPGSNSGTHGHVDFEFGSDVASASRDPAVTAIASPWCVRILNSRSQCSKSLLSHFYYPGSVYALSSVCFRNIRHHRPTMEHVFSAFITFGSASTALVLPHTSPTWKLQPPLVARLGLRPSTGCKKYGP